ncbi:MAG TPA: IclR family transcriptional regulator C-terminal domain-containing protein [Streptosporangiaceae bacterium]|nr:IclR family transcriptional regulator C-terminal domain-containing protein [Streptosporangiaceae bacterium]
MGHPKIDQPERAADTAVVAAPLRDGEGQVIAALNVTVHAAETPIEVLTGEYLPLLLQTASAISADWAACQAAPQIVRPGAGRVSAERTG